MTPSEIREWVLFTIAMVTIIGTSVGMWTKLVAKVNGIGGRVTKREQVSEAAITRLDILERQCSEDRVLRLDISTRLGKVEGKVEGIDTHMTEMKMELFAHLSDIKQMITQKDADLKELFSNKDANNRERLARLENQVGTEHRDR